MVTCRVGSAGGNALVPCLAEAQFFSPLLTVASGTHGDLIAPGSALSLAANATLSSELIWQAVDDDIRAAYATTLMPADEADFMQYHSLLRSRPLLRIIAAYC